MDILRRLESLKVLQVLQLVACDIFTDILLSLVDEAAHEGRLHSFHASIHRLGVKIAFESQWVKLADHLCMLIELSEDFWLDRCRSSSNNLVKYLGK
jgi:hypothetical protein